MAEPESAPDHLLGGRVALVQPPHGYRVAIDPVLLAAAVDAQPGERALDVGCGVGAAALCLMQRVADLAVTGVDLDADALALAVANARRNHRDRFATHQIDALAAPAALRALGPVDHVLTNPPFHPADATDASPDPTRARATVAEFALADWLAAAARALAPRGTLTMIHRADRLDDVLGALPRALGGVAVVPLWPRAGAPAKRVIVLARQGSSAPLALTAGLTLHRADGGFTDAAEAVLRDGVGLGDVVDGLWPARVRWRAAVAPAS